MMLTFDHTNKNVISIHDNMCNLRCTCFAVQPLLHACMSSSSVDPLPFRGWQQLTAFAINSHIAQSVLLISVCEPRISFLPGPDHYSKFPTAWLCLWISSDDQRAVLPTSDVPGWVQSSAIRCPRNDLYIYLRQPFFMRSAPPDGVCPSRHKIESSKISMDVCLENVQWLISIVTTVCFQFTWIGHVFQFFKLKTAVNN